MALNGSQPVARNTWVNPNPPQYSELPPLDWFTLNTQLTFSNAPIALLASLLCLIVKQLNEQFTARDLLPALD